jgi:hypothetical protein
MKSSLCRVLSVLVLAVPLCLAGEPAPKVASPDGRFVYGIVGGDDDESADKARVVMKQTGRTVWESPDDYCNPEWLRGAECLWSPDSRRFALNIRLGGRYEVTGVYCWDGSSFVAAPRLDELLLARVVTAREKQLDALLAKLPASFPDKEAIRSGSFQRRIWDNCRLRRWIDERTAEATAYSIRLVCAPGREEDQEDVAGSMRFVVRLEKDRRWRILGEENIPLGQAEATGP